MSRTPIQPVSKDLLYMKVADAIHNYIHENQLHPGDKIPSERVLAEQLHTGRNSVREALRVLENQGLIEVKTGRGAFVAEKGSPGSIYSRLFKVNYSELLEIKSILEREAIRRAAINASQEDLDELDAILSGIEEQAAAGIYAEAADKRFHHRLLRIGGNTSLVQTVAQLIEILSGYAMLLDDAEEIFITTIPYHRKMLEAIRQKDPDTACDVYAKILEIDVAALEAQENQSGK